MTDTAALRARLARLEAAFDAALTGDKVDVAMSDGEQMQFTKVDLTRLGVEIQQLRMRLGITSPSPLTGGL
jgi:hypothetical protein